MIKMHTLPPAEALQRAVSNYLNISRHKNDRQMFQEFNYWPAEEMAWTKLMEAVEQAKRLGILSEKTFSESLDKCSNV